MSATSVWSSLTTKIDGLCEKRLWDTFHGQKLLTRQAIIAGYIITYGLLLGLFLLDPHNLIERASVFSFSERTIGITTAFVALFIPVAIALIQDGISGELLRPIIVKDVVRLYGLALASAFALFYTLIPKIGDVRLWLAPIVFLCWIFFLGSLWRSYKWLVDIVSGVGSTMELKYRAGRSYRFARILKALRDSGEDRPWNAIWSRDDLPADFDEQLHSVFFATVNNDLKDSKNEEAILNATNKLTLYSIYFKNRDTNTWKFYSTYLQELLLIYARTMEIGESNRAARPYQSQQALKRIFESMFKTGLEQRQDYDIFIALNAYCDKRKLNGKISKTTGVKNDDVINDFLRILFDSIFEDKIGGYDVKTNFVNYPQWQVTFDNLYEQHLNISFIVENSYKEWLFGKLKEPNGKDLYKVDHVTQTFYPGVDSITLSKLYWLIYLSQSRAVPEQIIDAYMTTPRPFGMMGPIVNGWSSDKDSHDEVVRTLNNLQDAAVKLFATLYAQHLRQIWNVDELIKTINKKLRTRLSDDQFDSLKRLKELLKKVSDFYKHIDETTE